MPVPHHNEKKLEAVFTELFPNLFGRSNEKRGEKSSEDVSDDEEMEDKEQDANEKPRQRWVFELVDPKTVPEYYSRPPPRKIIRNGRVYYEGLGPGTYRTTTRKRPMEEVKKIKPSEE